MASRRCEEASSSSSLCCVCCKAVEDGKDEALLCEGQCQKWLHRYCAGVTVNQYEQLSLSDQPFFCFACCQVQHRQLITELRGEVEALRLEVSQLKAQQPLPQPQTSANELAKRCTPPAMREESSKNGGWQRVEKKRPPRKQHRSKQGADQATNARIGPTVSVSGDDSKKTEGKTKVVGARRVWGTLKACTVGTVKSVISRFCSNTTARVKRKIKDVQPGKPPRWWFVIHDSEESLQALEENWGSVHVQTNWKLEPCYKPMDSDNSTQPSTLPPPTTPTEINMLPSETPTVDVMQNDGKSAASPASLAVRADHTFLVQQ